MSNQNYIKLEDAAYEMGRNGSMIVKYRAGSHIESKSFVEYDPDNHDLVIPANNRENIIGLVLNTCQEGEIALVQVQGSSHEGIYDTPELSFPSLIINHDQPELKRPRNRKKEREF